jgi:hypothetical protein
VRQGLIALWPRVPPDRDALLAAILAPVQADAFRQLPVHDQSHLCAVYRQLRDSGIDDRGLLTAALLHDIGKVSPSGSARVRLGDRVALVSLRRVAPRLLRYLSRQPASWGRHGLALAVHHPSLGADRAATLGCSERVCWLIAHHADRPLPADTQLRLLIEADETCP